MIEFRQATYQNGHLILRQKLDETLEGQTLNVIVISGAAVAAKKENFLRFADKFAFNLPADYRFNRDALYVR